MAESDGTSGSNPDGLQPPAASDEHGVRETGEPAPTVSAESDTAELPSVQVIVPANTRPSNPGKRPKAARKRQQPLAATTLQSGAALQSTWKSRSGMPAAAARPDDEAAPDPGGARSGSDASGVHSVGNDDGVEVEVLPHGSTPPPSIQAHAQPAQPRDDETPRTAGHLPPADSSTRMESPRIISALADTQQDDARQRTQQQRAARSGRLARTLRMELKLGSGAPEPPPTAAPNASGGRSERQFIIGGSNSSEYTSGRPPLHNTDPMGTPSMRQHRGLLSDPRLQQSFTITGREAGSAPPPLPRRPPRPGERTMILTRRAHVATKDWMFVGLLVAALAVTASMLWSYRNQPGAETEAEAEQPGPGAGDGTDDPNAAAGPTTVEHAITADDNANEAPAAAPAANGGIRATELRSEPVGAEVVASGAVVGNTPVRVARGDGDTEYTLRMPGYEPQLVRVGSNSPATIHVTLQPKAAAPSANVLAPRESSGGPEAQPQPTAAPTPNVAASAPSVP